MAATTREPKQHVVVAVGDDVAIRGSDAGGERSSGEIVEKKGERPVDLEKGQVAGAERDCRICHLSLDAGNHDSGVPMELGCSCKDDLAAAHKHCAEAWFKIKGNKTCEICGSMAQNVSGVSEGEVVEQWTNESNDTAAMTPTAAPVVRPAESRNFWKGHRFLNFLLACIVFAFVISWLFHFNVPS